MKKALALFLALVMCLSLCACGSKEAPKTAQNEQVETTPVIQTLPPETTVPETTAAPKPVYETIEITMDNWQEYFEFRQSDVEWTEDAFGDVDRYMFVILFAIREEYLDIVKLDTIDIAFSCSYVQEYHYYNIDFENRTFAIGETVPKELLSAGVYSGEEHETNPTKMTRTECDAWHNLQYRDIITHWDANGTELISWADALDISRIQGTIEIQTN